MSKLTHLDEAGAARMVDVSDKATTKRVATAEGRIALSAEALAAIRDGALAKGDALAVARIAGIMAAKKTSELVPLCHPLPISAVAVDFRFDDEAIVCTASVTTTSTTGVEMEALTAVSVALLTLYDMAKAIDKGMTIGPVRLLAKSGGRSGDWARRMIFVAEAQARILALGSPLPVEQVPLREAAGRWAAAAVHARRDQPAADLSAMDGYALRFAELPGPWRVVGESAAGTGFDRALAPHEAARIFTGAPLPDGADTILVQEEAARDGDLLRLDGEGPAFAGAHVRSRASDFAVGAALLDAGALLTGPRIALAAIGGHGTLPVRRRPRVTLLSTGDELVAPGTPTPGVTLPASNAPMLAALLDPRRAIIEDAGIVPDRLDALVDAFRATAGVADVIVTTGGASVGDRDLVRPALEAAGASLDFWKVAMRPGKPLMAGRLGDTVVIGLPGNPVSAYVTATLFLLPLLAHISGSAAPLPRQTEAVLSDALPQVGARADYLRGRMEGKSVRPLQGQDSAALRMLADADVLIVRPPASPPAAAGDQVTIIPLA